MKDNSRRCRDCRNLSEFTTTSQKGAISKAPLCTETMERTSPGKTCGKFVPLLPKVRRTVKSPYFKEYAPESGMAPEDCYEKLYRLEGFEQRMGLPLETFLIACLRGFFYKKEGSIYWSDWTVHAYCGSEYGGVFIETMPGGDGNTHVFSWKDSLTFSLKDYGRTWALTKEELEK